MGIFERLLNKGTLFTPSAQQKPNKTVSLLTIQDKTDTSLRNTPYFGVESRK